jgi:hypothetical protein
MLAVVTVTTISCSLSRQYRSVLSLSFLDIYNLACIFFELFLRPTWYWISLFVFHSVLVEYVLKKFSSTEMK